MLLAAWSLYSIHDHDTRLAVLEDRTFRELQDIKSLVRGLQSQVRDLERKIDK